MPGRWWTQAFLRAGCNLRGLRREAQCRRRCDPKWQEVPVAGIVRRSGAKADPAEIEQFCLEELARYKVSRRYVFLDGLPRNALGKVRHFRLKQQIAMD